MIRIKNLGQAPEIAPNEKIVIKLNQDGTPIFSIDNFKELFPEFEEMDPDAHTLNKLEWNKIISDHKKYRDDGDDSEYFLDIQITPKNFDHPVIQLHFDINNDSFVRQPYIQAIALQKPESFTVILSGNKQQDFSYTATGRDSAQKYILDNIGSWD